MHLNKPSHDLVVELINKDNNRNFPPADLVIDQFTTVNGGTAYNTRARLTPRPGTRYAGGMFITYRRLDLNVALTSDEEGALEITVPNDGYINTVELCERLNQMYDLQMGAVDVVNQPLNLSVLPAQIVLQANANSPVWFGQRVIKFVVGRPMYSTTFTSTLLDGFTMPTADVSALTDPLSQRNVAVSFVDGSGNLRYGTGQLAGGFIVTANSEIEVASCARINRVIIAPNSDNEYTVAVGTSNDWSVLLSCGLLAGGDLAALYSLSVVITNPDDSVLTLKLERQSDNTYAAVNTALGISVPLQYTDPTAPYAVTQGSLGMRALASYLGTTIKSSSGTPLGVFAVRVQARRINSVAPRVMASYLVKAVNG